MKYKVSNIQDGEWNGTKFLKADLTDDQNVVEPQMAFWKNEITKDTTEIDGMIESYEKDGKTKKRFTTGKKASYGAYSAAQSIEKAKVVEEIRNTNIKANMGDKERGIAWTHSHKLALEFVEKYVCNPQVSGVDEALQAVRKYTDIFFKDWEHWNGQAF